MLLRPPVFIYLNRISVVIPLEIRIRNTAGRNKEWIGITSILWIDFRPSYAFDVSEKTPAGKYVGVLFPPHAFMYQVGYILIRGMHFFQ